MRNRMVAGAFAVALLTVVGATAGDALKSGTPVGKSIPGAFHPLNLTGAKAGEKHCLV